FRRLIRRQETVSTEQRRKCHQNDGDQKLGRDAGFVPRLRRSILLKPIKITVVRTSAAAIIIVAAAGPAAGRDACTEFSFFLRRIGYDLCGTNFHTLSKTIKPKTSGK